MTLSRLLALFTVLFLIFEQCTTNQEQQVADPRLESFMSVLDLDGNAYSEKIYITELYEDPHILLFKIEPLEEEGGDNLSFERVVESFEKVKQFECSEEGYSFKGKFLSTFSSNNHFKGLIKSKSFYKGSDELNDFILFMDHELKEIVSCNENWSSRVLIKIENTTIYGIADIY